MKVINTTKGIKNHIEAEVKSINTIRNNTIANMLFLDISIEIKLIFLELLRGNSKETSQNILIYRVDDCGKT